MPILLDRRSKIFLGSRDTMDRSTLIFPTDDGTPNPNIVQGWCRIEDNGTYTDIAETNIITRYFELVMFTRWDRTVSQHPILLTRVELVGEPYADLQTFQNPDGRWRVTNRSNPLGQERRRYLQFTLQRASYPITNI